jgi:hypothetical protein
LESNIGICIYSYKRANARYACRQKLNDKKTAPTTTVTITKRPALVIAAPAAVMVATAITVGLLGLHIQVLCLQFVHVVLNHLKVSTRFELARKIWLRICELQNRFEGNMDDSRSNSCTTGMLSSMSQE